MSAFLVLSAACKDVSLAALCSEESHRQLPGPEHQCQLCICERHCHKHAAVWQWHPTKLDRVWCNGQWRTTHPSDGSMLPCSANVICGLVCIHALEVSVALKLLNSLVADRNDCMGLGWMALAATEPFTVEMGCSCEAASCYNCLLS